MPIADCVADGQCTNTKNFAVEEVRWTAVKVARLTPILSSERTVYSVSTFQSIYEFMRGPLNQDSAHFCLVSIVASKHARLRAFKSIFIDNCSRQQEPAGIFSQVQRGRSGCGLIIGPWSDSALILSVAFWMKMSDSCCMSWNYATRYLKQCRVCPTSPCFAKGFTKVPLHSFAWGIFVEKAFVAKAPDLLRWNLSCVRMIKLCFLSPLKEDGILLCWMGWMIGTLLQLSQLQVISYLDIRVQMCLLTCGQTWANTLSPLGFS